MIADQQNHTFDLKITEKSTGITSTRTGLPFNDPNAGYIRKVWFAMTDNDWVMFDNIIVYQSTDPTARIGSDHKLPGVFEGARESQHGHGCQFLRRRGPPVDPVQDRRWRRLDEPDQQRDHAFNLSGPLDRSVTGNRLDHERGFHALPEGESQIYFRATDHVPTVTESAGYLSFLKDTQPPDTASVTVPDAPVIPALTVIQGLARDMGSGLAANSVTFTLQRLDNNQYWKGNGWQVASSARPTTHAAASGGTTVSWTNNGATSGQAPTFRRQA